MFTWPILQQAHAALAPIHSLPIFLAASHHYLL